MALTGVRTVARFLLLSILISYPLHHGFANKTMPPKALKQFVVRNWAQDDGLPDNTIRDIEQTNDGFIWLACSSGLARFDGEAFKVYNQNSLPQLKAEVAWDLQAMPDGSLWAGFLGGGLLHVNQGEVRIYETQDGLSGNWVSALMLARDRTLWVGTDSVRISLIKDGKITSVNLPVADLGYITTIYEDGAGRIWIGDTNARIFIYQDGQFNTFSTGTMGDVTAFSESTDGNMWVGTKTGLFQWEEGRGRESGIAALSGEEVTHLTHDDQGRMWISSTKGLARMEGAHVDWFDQLGIRAIRVYSFMEGREGNYWVGSYSDGLIQLTDGMATSWSLSRPGMPDHVRTVFQSSDGAIWVGSFDNGLRRYRDGKLDRFTTEHGLLSDRVWGIQEDREGQIWLGTENGLMQFDEGGNHKTWLEGMPIRFLYETRSGERWVGSVEEGIAEMKDNSFRWIRQGDGLSSNNVRGMVEAHDNELWVWTENGLTQMINGQVNRVYTTRDGLPHNWVVGAYYDQDDASLWLGTVGGGLGRIRNGQVSSFSKKDGLYNNSAWSIVPDGNGRIWMSCDLGIYGVSLKDFDRLERGEIEKLRSFNIGKEHGLENLEFNGGGFPTGMACSNGKIWFPSMGGAVDFDPSQLDREAATPTPRILGLVVNGKERGLGYSILSPGRKELLIRYTAPGFAALAPPQFRYMLEGFHENWVNVQNRREVYFTNLLPQTYRFRLQVSAGGPWKEAEQQLSFTLQPLVRQTWWFRTLCVLLIFGLLWAYHKFRTRAIKRKAARFQQALAEEVDKRTHELAQKNLELERLDEIVRTLNAEVTLPEVITSVIQQGMELFPNADSGSYFMVDATDGTYRVRSTVGVEIERVTHLSFEPDEIMEYLENGEQREEGIVVLADLDRAQTARGMARPQAVLVMLVPISDRPPGLLFLINREDNKAFKDSDVLRLRRFRDHAVTAVNKALTLQDLVLAQAELVEHAQLVGMAEIASEVLHHVGNALNSINVSAEGLEQTLSHREESMAFFQKTLSLIEDESNLREDKRLQLFSQAMGRVYHVLSRQDAQLRCETKTVAEYISEIDQILRAQQEHAHAAAKRPELIDLNSMLDDLLHKRAWFLKVKNILVVRRFKEIPLISVERVKFSHILYYLLTNAWEAIEADAAGRTGRITLTTDIHDECVQLSMVDNGVGFNPAIATQLFNYGYTTKNEGKGIGLHYCANAIKEMRGTISIHSEGPGHGARVTLAFPAMESA